VFFQKTIYKVKIINLQKFRLYKVSKILKWQKVSRQDKKNLKSANLSKCTEALKVFPEKNYLS
jgi:hypothetical protein